MGHESVGTTRHYDRRESRALGKEKVNEVYGYNLPNVDLFKPIK